MKVILLLDIAKLGRRGDVKEVADSYAVNVLIPKKQVVQATSSELAKWESQKKSKEHKKEITKNNILHLLDLLKKEALVLEGKKYDQKGQLFASVKETDIVELIFKITQISINPKQIIIPIPIKNVGKHFFEIKQGDTQEKVELQVK
jgi:large subunit ribosomal protein L9